MKKNQIILISIFAGAVGIFLIIVGAITRNQVGVEDVYVGRQAGQPAKPGPSLKKELGLADLAGAKEEPAKYEKEKEYALEEISVEEARQLEGRPQAGLSEGSAEEGAAEPADGEKKFNVQPPANKLDEMKTQGIVIY